MLTRQDLDHQQDHSPNGFGPIFPRLRSTRLIFECANEINSLTNSSPVKNVNLVSSIKYVLRDMTAESGFTQRGMGQHIMQNNHKTPQFIQ